MDRVGGLGLPQPRQPQLVSISNVRDMNPFPGPRPLLLDAQSGRGVGRGAALANLLATYNSRGPATDPKPPVVNPLDVEATAIPLLPCFHPHQLSRPCRDLGCHGPPHRATPYWRSPLSSAHQAHLRSCPLSADVTVPADAEKASPASWSEMVDEAEMRGELDVAPPDSFPWDEPAAQPSVVKTEQPQTDPSASPASAGSNDSLWEELAEASAAADALLAAPSDVTYAPTIPPEQVRLLDLVRPYWLKGEEGISHAVHALVFDHGMDYSPATLDHILAWLLLQRRDIALHLRVWLVHRTGPDHDPHHVLEELKLHLLSLEDA